MTEQLTQEAALGLARHIAARIADRDGATALAADILGGFHDVATEVKAAIEAIRAMECHHEAENARLQRIADHAPGFEVPIIASLRAEIVALKANLAERPTICAAVVGAVEQARGSRYTHSGLYEGLTQAAAALRATHTITGGKDD